MAVPALIPELEDVIQSGSAERRTQALRQKITDLFLDGASLFNEEHVDLFDDVFNRLIDEIEAKARAELSHRSGAGRQRAGGWCSGSPGTTTFRWPARSCGSRAGWPRPTWWRSPRPRARRICSPSPAAAGIAETVTNVLVRRGDQEVARNVADNRGARLSDDAFTALVERAEQDDVLAEKVGSGRTSRRRYFASSCSRRPRWCSSGCWRPRSAGNPGRNPQVLARVSNEVTAPPPRCANIRRPSAPSRSCGARPGSTKAQIVEFAKAAATRR